VLPRNNRLRDFLDLSLRLTSPSREPLTTISRQLSEASSGAPQVTP
jgi:hypothetical protein